MLASTSSFTAFALAPGALKTGTPRRLIASTGMLFTPVPQRPTAFTVAGMSPSASTWERSRIASGSAMPLPTANSGACIRARPRDETELKTATRKRGIIASAVALRELFHELDQRLDALVGHGVVDRGAHAAHAAVPLQGRKPARLGLLEEE